MGLKRFLFRQELTITTFSSARLPVLLVGIIETDQNPYLTINLSVWYFPSANERFSNVKNSGCVDTVPFCLWVLRGVSIHPSFILRFLKALRPMLWGPLSEQYGRRPIFIYPFFVYAVS